MELIFMFLIAFVCFAGGYKNGEVGKEKDILSKLTNDKKYCIEETVKDGSKRETCWILKEKMETTK